VSARVLIKTEKYGNVLSTQPAALKKRKKAKERGREKDRKKQTMNPKYQAISFRFTVV
jgi:hypothetical protein